MKKKWTPHIIAVAVLVVFVVLGLASTASSPDASNTPPQPKPGVYVENNLNMRIWYVITGPTIGRSDLNYLDPGMTSGPRRLSGDGWVIYYTTDNQWENKSSVQNAEFILWANKPLTGDLSNEAITVKIP